MGDFTVRFWGVRGSIAAPGPDTVRYGGNTSCVEVRCGENLFILDGGTGLRPLGEALAAEGPLDADVFFSHTHFDHICGIPFFSPAFNPDSIFRMRAGHLRPDFTLCEVLQSMMRPPLFPVPMEIFKAEVSFSDFLCGEVLRPRPGVTIHTAPLNHPDRATGYRIEYGGRSVCYVTDTAHVPGHPNQSILRLIQGADLVIYDAMFTEEEFACRPSWGHSTWNEGARLCDLAGAGRLVLFHHDPARDDAALDQIAAEAARARPGTVVAREGLVIEP